MALRLYGCSFSLDLAFAFDINYLLSVTPFSVALQELPPDSTPSRPFLSISIQDFP